MISAGVKGLVTNLAGNPVQGAHVTFKDRAERYLNTTALGEYWKLLLPGNYSIQVGFTDWGGVYRGLTGKGREGLPCTVPSEVLSCYPSRVL